MAANPVAGPELNMEVKQSPEETTVHCTGRSVSSTTAQFQSTVRALIPETKRVIIDLTDVAHVDSSGLGSLVAVYLSAKRAKCELRLINLSQRIKDLFRLTNLSKIFEGHEDYLGITMDS